MKLSSSEAGGTQVVCVESDRLDAAVAIAFKDRFRELTEGGTGPVRLDMSRVGFLDSSGLGAVVAALKMMGKRKLQLAGLQTAVMRVFTLTRMDSVFEIQAGGATDRLEGDAA